MFALLFGLLAAAVAIVTSSLHPLSTELNLLVTKIRELAREAGKFHSKGDRMQPFVSRVLELLAGTQVNGLTTKSVRDMLYLTPNWAALTSYVVSYTC